MKRPDLDIKDYLLIKKTATLQLYIHNLENYCDHIEIELSQIKKSLSNVIKELSEIHAKYLKIDKGN